MEHTPEHDLGRPLSIDAEAVGQPGQRRFRLLVRSTNETAYVWMEKQQIAGIGDWFDVTLERLDREHPNNDPDVEPLPISGIATVEFTAGQLGLGYLEDEDLFTLHAFDIEHGAEGEPAMRCQLTRGQCRVLAKKIASVVAGGRPICPLCEMPIEPEGHVCPRSNGHFAGASVN
jgi:uncharacterized repeat protein (TIGR03847 family)